MGPSYGCYLNRGIAIEAKDQDGWTTLLRAAYRGHKAVVQLLLDRGAAIEAKDSQRLDGAVAGRRSRSMRPLYSCYLTEALHIEAKDEDGWTALFCAALQGA